MTALDNHKNKAMLKLYKPTNEKMMMMALLIIQYRIWTQDYVTNYTKQLLCCLHIIYLVENKIGNVESLDIHLLSNYKAVSSSGFWLNFLTAALESHETSLFQQHHVQVVLRKDTGYWPKIV